MSNVRMATYDGTLEPLYVCECNPDMPISRAVAIGHVAQTAAWAKREMESEKPAAGIRVQFIDGIPHAESHKLTALSAEESARTRAGWAGKRCQNCGTDDHCSECCVYRECKRADAAMWYVQQQMIAEGSWPETMPTDLRGGVAWKDLGMDPHDDWVKEWQRRAVALLGATPDCKTGEIRAAIEQYAAAEPAYELHETAA